MHRHAESEHQTSLARPCPTIVTGDIQAGIEKHIAEQVRTRATAISRFRFEGKELKLKLVRVHVEYLVSLAPRRHFACVDMASSDGQFYDIDFFLEGDPGAMTVTETTVHKLNGSPYYVWKQNEDKPGCARRSRRPRKELLGVLTGRDAFEFRYQATLPEIAGDSPLLASAGRLGRLPEGHREVHHVRRARQRTLTDSAYGNRVLFLELGPEDSGKTDRDRVRRGAPREGRLCR